MDSARRTSLGKDYGVDNLVESVGGAISRIESSRTRMGWESANSGRLSISLVSQLDALMIDTEFISLMRTGVDECLKSITLLENLASRAGPEIGMLLRLVLWVFSVRVNRPLPGDALHSLKYRNEKLFSNGFASGLRGLPGDQPTRLQRFLHGLGTVIVPWLWERCREYSIVNSWDSKEDLIYDKLARAMGTLEKVFSLASLFNTCAFFFDGRYRSLLDRMLQLRVVHANVEHRRTVSFEFMNHQLFYDGFSQMLFCLLPLVNWRRLHSLGTIFGKKISRLIFLYSLYIYKNLKQSFRDVKRSIETETGLRLMRYVSDGDTEDSMDLTAAKPYDRLSVHESDDENNYLLTQSACATCDRDPPCMPYRTSCGHLHCYFCLKSQEMQILSESLQRSMTCSCGSRILSSDRAC